MLLDIEEMEETEETGEEKKEEGTEKKEEMNGEEGNREVYDQQEMMENRAVCQYWKFSVCTYMQKVMCLITVCCDSVWCRVRVMLCDIVAGLYAR